jgi:Zn-dependent protease
MDLSPEQVRWIIQAIIILVLSICVHEWGHAFVADKLGDSLPRSQGRVSLNPARHADPIGTLVFPLIALVFTGGKSLGFGWGKPVQVQPHSFSRRFSMRTGHMFVALAGPVMNLVLGTIITLLHVLLLKFGVIQLEVRPEVIPSTWHEVLLYAALLNFILFFFNLIPAPPLDGGAVLEGLLPTRFLPTYQRFAVYGPFVLMAVIFVPGLASVFVKPAMVCQEGLFQILFSAIQ